MEFDVKAFLQHHLPELFELIPENKIDWRRLEKKYKVRYEEILSKHKIEGTTEYEASIFEILMYASRGRRDAVYLLTFIKETIQKLNILLTPQELRLITDNIAMVITNLDMKYLNFIGEVAFLVIIKEQTKWILSRTEIENDFEKRIDFEFKSDEFRKVKIEIMNIHLTKEIGEGDDKIKKFLTKRIEDKKAAKTNNNLGQIDFLLAPVIWGPVSELKKVSNYLKCTPWTIPMTLVPISFVNFTDKNGDMFQKFKALETIFD